jgi:hypothetical protein
MRTLGGYLVIGVMGSLMAVGILKASGWIIHWMTTGLPSQYRSWSRRKTIARISFLRGVQLDSNVLFVDRLSSMVASIAVVVWSGLITFLVFEHLLFHRFPVSHTAKDCLPFLMASTASGLMMFLITLVVIVFRCIMEIKLSIELESLDQTMLKLQEHLRSLT